MLRVRVAAAIAAVVALTVCFLPSRATADGGGGGGGVSCGPLAGNCSVSASSSPSPVGGGSGGSGGGSGGGSASCSFHGQSFPCYNQLFGWFDGQDGCYYKLMSPQPDASSALWQGHKPGDGAIYAAECPLISGKGLPGGNAQWFQNPPPGFGGAVNVQALAQQAVSKMGLLGPAIGIAPPPGSKGVVGLPVWLWDNVSATTWGPNSASASAGAVTVTATGSVTQIVWDMGDGQSVTCTGPGEAYQASFGSAQPPCGHTYTQTSAAMPDGQYAINATATWVVNWQATTGQTGQITVTRQSASSVVIGELRDLNN